MTDPLAAVTEADTENPAPDLHRVSGDTRHSVSGKTGRARRRAIGAIALTVIVLLAGVLVYEYLPVNSVCAISTRLGEYNVTVPSVITNMPLGGGSGFNVTGQNWTFFSGSVILGNTAQSDGGYGGWSVHNGSGLNVQLAQLVFAVYSVHNVSRPVSTGPDPCTQPYVAQVVSPAYCDVDFVGYSFPGPANDSNEPQVFNSSCIGAPIGPGVTPGGYVRIDNSYPSSPLPGENTTLNLCSWTGDFSQSVYGAVLVPITLVVPLGGSNLRVYGFLWWDSLFVGSPTASYTLPYGSIWKVASVGLFSENTPGLLPPGLLAFERLPCP